MYDPEPHVRVGETYVPSRKACCCRGLQWDVARVPTGGLEKSRVCGSIGLVGAREGGAEPLVVFWEEVVALEVAVLCSGAGRR